ncbi:MAG TPA: hypothetical protein VG757_01895 [Devosia sp.]|nr:hypothetical protein [Devosia sp.]
MRTLAILLVAAVLPLAGCSTQYGAMGNMGGVAAAPIASDIYRISARGNGYTDATTIQDYALLKAAETTLAAGKTHFTVLQNRDATDKTYGQTAGTINTYGSFATYNPGFTYDIVKPGEDMMIRVWSPGPKDAIPPNTFNAAEVFNNINPRVKRAKT